MKQQTEQGKRLKAFRLEKGFMKKSSFARYVKTTPSTISAIEDNGREISGTVLDAICFAFPDINPDWILTGKLPKLLTDYPLRPEVVNVSDPKTNYQLQCSYCIKKQAIIDDLKTELLELQKQYIECLKKVEVLNRVSG